MQAYTEQRDESIEACKHPEDQKVFDYFYNKAERAARAIRDREYSLIKCFTYRYGYCYDNNQNSARVQAIDKKYNDAVDKEYARLQAIFPDLY